MQDNWAAVFNATWFVGRSEKRRKAGKLPVCGQLEHQAGGRAMGVQRAVGPVQPGFGRGQLPAAMDHLAFGPLFLVRLVDDDDRAAAPGLQARSWSTRKTGIPR